MILTGAPFQELSEVIEAEVEDVPSLTLLALDVGEELAKIAPGRDMTESVFALLNRLNSAVPPKIDQFLEVLSKRGNARLRATANKLLKPEYFSPTGNAIDAIVLGRTAFIARKELRDKLRQFINASTYSTRVLFVRGDQPGGKSYTWEFLHHLARDIGAEPVSLNLKNTRYDPRQFFEQVYRLLLLDDKTIPELKDAPQLARLDTLINAFKGRLNTLTKRYWLVIDDLNDSSVEQSLREAAYALAQVVEKMKPQNLWVALLGYNDEYNEMDLRHVARDDAEFPSPDLVARHLDLISGRSSLPLPAGRADEIAQVLFSRYPDKLNKEAMLKITMEVEDMGEKLARGEHP